MHQLKANDVLGAVNRGNPAESGLCTLCRADCAGKCETWLTSLKGRDCLYPRDFGVVTAGSDNNNPLGVSYNALRIQGRAYGAENAPPSARQGDVLFTDVSLETRFGPDDSIKCRYPFITGAIGSTEIAAKYWDSFAAGSALCGIPIVIGENVVGVDQNSKFSGNAVVESPELERRINSYMRYYDGYGAIFVQMNVEDTRNGVAEYVIEKFGDNVVLELKWGQGAKCIGGEIFVSNIEYARFLRERGYLLDPNPALPEVSEAFMEGGVTHFARHSRLGYTHLNSFAEVREAFLNHVAHLRRLGYKRITLKTGAYGMQDLAAAIYLASEAGLDLLNIDGAGGGTGMSPWEMMEHWGVPSLLLHAKTHEYMDILMKRGKKPVPLALGGGFAKAASIFKGLALGAPYTRLISMGRAMMIPGFLGANIEGVLKPDKRAGLHGNWSSLPKSVEEIGLTPETIFAGYHTLREKVGHKDMPEVPFGAIAMWTLLDALGAGLQQFMAGARKFTLAGISRDDIASANRETERETGIPFITDAHDEQAKAILLS